MASVKGRAVVNCGPGTPWEMKEYPVPDPEPNAIVTKMTLSSICGSDIRLQRRLRRPARKTETEDRGP